MKVKEIMSTDITCVSPDDSVQKAAQLMKHYDVGSIPVCEDGEVIGILTDRDITLRAVAEGREASAQTVADIMTDDLVVAYPDMSACDATRLMSQQQVRRLPVVENGHLVGIVSLGDISLEPNLQEDAKEALSDISDPGGPPSMQ